MIPSPSNTFGNYVDHVIQVFENGEIVPSWRVHAIDTSRYLLAYTSVFLLSTLILFTASAKAQQRQLRGTLDLKEPLTHAEANGSATPDRFRRTISRGMETVHEHTGEEVGGDECDNMSIGANSELTMGTNKRRVHSHRVLSKRSPALEQSAASSPSSVRASRTG